MRLSVVLTDEKGNRYGGTVVLTPAVAKRAPQDVPDRSQRQGPASVSFAHNPRAFMKKYGHGLNGSQKFTLLLARLAQGNPKLGITNAELQKQWNSMKSLMGGPFNTAHSLRAKDNGWVDTPKRGVYVVVDSWKEALKNGA